MDIYDEENQIYTPYNFLDFCGFECRYNELTEKYDVNGLASSTLLIASFEDEELAVTVTRSLFTLKSMAEVNPQMEARFINVDMIVDELENEQKIEEAAFFNATKTFICIFVGIIIGYLIMYVVNL